MAGLVLRNSRRGPRVLFFDLTTRGPSLFSNLNPKLAVLGVSRGQMEKIRPFLYVNGGHLYSKSGLTFSFWPPGGEFI